MDVDLVIIGAGINGCGIAADAAGRGLKVALVDKGDVSSATSNASTKLIHGGLRYLENFKFSMVKESLHEQNWLQSHAKYLLEPLEFIIPNSPVRPSWQVRLGLYLYDKLTQRSLPQSFTLDTAQVQSLALTPTPYTAFCYYDYQSDDHRLGVCEAIDARQRGAQIFLNTQVESISSHGAYWHIEIKQKAGNKITLRSRALVNATGPWVEQFAQQHALPHDSKLSLRLSQGSHLILKQLYPGKRAYLLQADDKRVIFTIPFHGHTLVGTTDLELEKMPSRPTIEQSETEYLLALINKHFSLDLGVQDILQTYSGVRALLDTSANPSDCSRESKIIAGRTAGQAACWHVIGGKITTWRALAESVVNKIAPLFKTNKGPWTSKKLLPGARLNTSAQEICVELQHQFPHMPPELLVRLSRTYGTRSYQIIGQSRLFKHLGHHFGGYLTEREIEFLCDNEWVNDYSSLMRRTRVNFTLDKKQLTDLKNLFKKQATLA